MIRTKTFKERMRQLWITIKWALYFGFAYTLIKAFGNDRHFGEGWYLNLPAAIIALSLLTPERYKAKLDADGKPVSRSSASARFGAAMLLLLIPILGIGGIIHRAGVYGVSEYEAYVAYQKLTPAEKKAFDLAEAKRAEEEAKEAMALKKKIREEEYWESEREKIKADFAFEQAVEAAKRKTEPKRISYTACVNTGIAWFKEIGSYPNLSTGESAEYAARDRCGRTTSAFGPWD